MKHYEKMLAKGCFSREQLIELVGTATAANQVIYEYQKKGLIEKVKRDLYVVISIMTLAVNGNFFRLSQIRPALYILQVQIADSYRAYLHIVSLS